MTNHLAVGNSFTLHSYLGGIFVVVAATVVVVVVLLLVEAGIVVFVAAAVVATVAAAVVVVLACSLWLKCTNDKLCNPSLVITVPHNETLYCLGYAMH